MPRPASVQIGREIFANDYDDELIRVFDAATGAHVRDLPNGFFEGMGFVAGELFVSETTGPGALNVIKVYDADTFAHLRTLDVSAAVPGSMIAGLGGDGLPQEAAVDYYQVVVGASGALLLETALPAGGPGEFQNGLYPALALYDAGGALVADADGNVDGRNSRLEFAAGGLAAGTYYVAVTPSTATPDTAGEYILRVVDNSVVLPPFYVSATSPPDGFATQVAPDTFRRGTARCERGAISATCRMARCPARPRSDRQGVCSLRRRRHRALDGARTRIRRTPSADERETRTRGQRKSKDIGE